MTVVDMTSFINTTPFQFDFFLIFTECFHFSATVYIKMRCSNEI
jgi:hypothetical protein